jgi:hypothetical protein
MLESDNVTVMHQSYIEILTQKGLLKKNNFVKEKGTTTDFQAFMLFYTQSSYQSLIQFLSDKPFPFFMKTLEKEHHQYQQMLKVNSQTLMGDILSLEATTESLYALEFKLLNKKRKKQTTTTAQQYSKTKRKVLEKSLVTAQLELQKAQHQLLTLE